MSEAEGQVFPTRMRIKQLPGEWSYQTEFDDFIYFTPDGAVADIEILGGAAQIDADDARELILRLQQWLAVREGLG